MATYSTLLAATLWLLLKPTSYLVDAGQDLTRMAGSSGDDVVEASVALVQESTVFPDDNQFLRRLAWVESQDGKGPDTYRSGYYGGIWQVDETFLLITQDVTNTPSLTGLFESLYVQFDIEWSSVQKEDLLKPVFSALAARIYLWTLPDPIPLASDIQGQARYWQNHYRPNELVETFVQAIQNLESSPDCQTRGMDLVFLLDSSGSIGNVNYNRVLNFTANIVSQLDIGPSATQIGLVIFSSHAQDEFHLNTYGDSVSVIHAVEGVPYLSGGTNTPEGLDELINEFNTTSFGARPEEQGIPRVAIVVTDGQSNEGGGPPATIANAQRVHDNNILTFAIGVGDSINEAELNAIATSAAYVYQLEDFDIHELQQLQETISYQSCKVPVIGDVEDDFHGVLKSEESAYFQFDLPRVGMTLKIEVNVGTVVVYISNKIRNPNEAIYDWKLKTSVSEDVFISMAGLEISLPPSTSTPGSSSPPTAAPQETVATTDTNITIYVSVQGNAITNNFTLNTTYGDTTVKEVADPTTATTTSTESGIPMLLVWTVIGGTLLAGLVILIAIVIFTVKVKRFAQRSERRSRGPPYRTIVALEERYNAD